jgi:hypothetical protein
MSIMTATEVIGLVIDAILNNVSGRISTPRATSRFPATPS